MTTEVSSVIALDDAIAALPEGDYVHTFLSGGVLLGADWPRALIIAALTESPDVQITGQTAQRMGHGLACRHPRTGDTLFVETRYRTDEPLPQSAVETSQIAEPRPND